MSEILLPGLPPGFTARVATADDADAILDVAGAVEMANDGTIEIHRTDIAQVFELASPGAIVVATDAPAKDLSAAGWVIEGRAEVYVDPERRGRGLGAAFLDWTEERARRDGRERVRQTITDNDHRAHRLLASHGYDRGYTSWVLQIELADAPPEIALPPAIAIRAFAPEDALATFDVIEDAFREWRGRDPQTFDHWTSFIVQHEAFAPALSRLAFDGQELVGAAIAFEYDGSDEGWVQQLATRASHRHRGIARALLQSTFAAFHATGRRLAGLSTDSRTGALSLYERVGMHVRRSYTSWTKDLARSSSPRK